MSCYYTELNDEALLHISGPESLKFLQGQTTCDTRTVNAKQAVPGAYCTPKGRVVCDFLLCELSENHFALRLRRDIVDISAATFGKYIIFSKAELDKSNADWQVFGCWGEDIASTLYTAVGATRNEEQPFCAASGMGFVIIQIDDDANNFECYINTRTHPELVAQLASTMTAADQNDWRARQIDLGIARIEAATVEVFVPQMLNYDLSGHISFNKGCYTGQEVVARLHYRGKPKKRLFRATLASVQLPPAGTPLFGAGSSQSAGTVVNAAPGDGSLMLALIVAPVAGIESGLHLGNPNGPCLNYVNITPDSAG